MQEINFNLVYPVGLSVNHMYVISSKKVFLKKEAVAYKKYVYFTLANQPKFKDVPLSVTLDIYPPDKRKRDLDNVLKLVLDSLQYSQVIDNDCNIYELHVTKKSIVKDGLLKISIKIKDNDER